MGMAVIVNEPLSKGWQGELELLFEHRQERTVLARCRRQGPLTVQRPFYPEDDCCHLYLLHPPSGLVGGDRLRTHIHLAPGAKSLLTTPGATQFYRSNGRLASQEQTLEVAPGAFLEWFPQETILFPGARAGITTRVALKGHGGFIGWEILCLGRPAIGERFSSGTLTTSLLLERDGRPLLHERLELRSEPDLDLLSGLQGQPVTATMVASGCSSQILSDLRSEQEACRTGFFAMTLLDDLLVVRYLGHSTAEVKELFRSVWHHIRPLVSGRTACPPRVWNT